MRRALRFGLRVRLLAWAVIAVGPLVALVLYSSAEDRRREIAQLERFAQQAADFAADEEEQLVDGARQLLIALANVPEVRDHDQVRCDALLAELLKQYRRYLNFGVVGPGGDVISSAVPSYERVNAADRQYFRIASQTHRFAIGDYQVGRITGKPSVNFGYPVLDAKGQLEAVIFAALDLEWLHQREIHFCAQLPAGVVSSKVDDDGLILVRHPDVERRTGQHLPEREVLDRAKTEGHGVMKSLSPEGVPSVYAFATVRSALAGGDLHVVMGVPEATLFAGVNRVEKRNLVILAAVALLTLAAASLGGRLLVIRPAERLLETIHRLEAGDLSARTELPSLPCELGELAVAFDRMAQALERREAERKQADERLHKLSGRLLQLQDEERRHLARELHDTAAQNLAGTAMNLSVLSAFTPSLDAKAAAALAEAAALVDQCSAEIRTMCYLLHPPTLEALGLANAVREYADGFAQRSGIRVDLEISPSLHRLDKDYEVALFRVLQESLANVHRHSGSTTASIRLLAEAGMARLEVEDSGCGVPAETLRTLDGLAGGGGLGVGIAGMRERLRQLGGRLEIDSDATGTTVRAVLPLRDSQG